MLSHLVDVSIRCVVLALIAAAVLWLLRAKRTAAMEHAVWTAVVCGMLALLVFGSVLPRLPLRVLRSDAVPVMQPVESIQRAIGGTPAATAAVVRETPQLKIDWFELGYAAIALVFLARFAMGMFLVRRLIAKSVAVDGFRESERITVPLTVGWLRPVILLPMEWREWDGAKLDAVLAHEGAHAARHDGLVAAMAGVNRCIFWFHPLARWLEQRLALLAELACDEACVAAMGDREAYARLLVEMAQVVDRSRGRLRGHALTMAAGSHIGKRVNSILKDGRTSSRGLSRTGWAAIALCGVPMIWGAGAVTLDRRVLAQVKEKMRFEVASIRPARAPPTSRGGDGKSGGGGAPNCRMGYHVDAGRVDVSCYSLTLLISEAFDVFIGRVKGPDWMTVLGPPLFDISAKLPQGASPDEVPAMLQALLEERFKLTYHRETKEEPGLVLVVAKGGARLTEAGPGAEIALPAVGPDGNPLTSGPGNLNGIKYKGARIPNPDAPGTMSLLTSPAMGLVRDGGSGAIIRLEASSISAQGLADLVTMVTGQGMVPVVDMTGLKGRYQVNLDVSMAEALAVVDKVPDTFGAALVNGMQDALKKYGLHLEPRKTPVEYFVVDHIEKAPTEN